jgi:hypothetical protein
MVIWKWLAFKPIGRPSRPRLGRRGHWKCGGSTAVATGAPPAAPVNATAVLVLPPLGVAPPDGSDSVNVVCEVGLPDWRGGLACQDSFEDIEFDCGWTTLTLTLTPVCSCCCGGCDRGWECGGAPTGDGWTTPCRWKKLRSVVRSCWTAPGACIVPRRSGSADTDILHRYPAPSTR